MRITIVLGPFLPVPPVLGGAVEKVHLLLAEGYRAAGHDVTIISRKYKNWSDDETIDGIRYLRVTSCDRSSSLAANLAFDFFYALCVSRKLPQSDITITNSFFLPMLLHHQTAGKIYVHVARFPKHQMLLYSCADRLQAISRSVAKEIIRQAPSLASKVVTIGYPVPDEYFALDPSIQKKKIILFVGRIAREKGVHLLLKAFGSVLKQTDNIAGWKLRIVGPHDVSQGGDGSAYFDELVRLAQPLGSACEFVGPVFEQQKLIKEYQEASVFVYPSLAEKGEALGLAPMEAMAAGCAVIVSNLQCFDDYVQDGVNAFKFEHDNQRPENELAAVLGRLLANPQLTREISSSGEIAVGKFRISKIAKKMLDDFGSLVRK